MNHVFVAKRVKEAITVLPDRYQTVLRLRYGIEEEPKTLEQIGDYFGVTRERIRQMEVKALHDLAYKAGVSLAPCFEWTHACVKGEGGIVAEPHFLDVYGKNQRGSLVLILYLGEEFLRGAGTREYHHHWYIDESIKKQAMNELARLINYLKTNNKLLDAKEVRRYVSNINFLRLSKVVALSPLGSFGLIHWPEVLPKGVKDKAYIVLKQAQRPLHFLEITERINALEHNTRRALKQTVHNELIKDERFVLVGRGLYGLREWGFREGTIKDIIVSIFRDKGSPLAKEEVIPLVLKERFVQKNTILLNLHNERYFKRLQDGRYVLRRI